jgi:hypothetical protein
LCASWSHGWDQRPHIWGISGHISGGSAASYLEDKQPHIWRISSHISGGSATTYLEDQRPHIWFTVEIRLTQPQVELELGLSLAILKRRKKTSMEGDIGT